jgi:hypothetical protein
MTPDRGDDALRGLYRGIAPPDDHPDEDTWVRFSTGALDEVSRARLADHIVACGSCASVYRALGVLREHAASTGEASPANAGTSGWRATTTWLAAAATLALAVTAVVLQMQTTSPTPGDAAQPPASPVDTSPGPPSAPSAVSARAWAGTVDAPAVELPARYALVVRGPGSKEAFLKAFGPAIEPYREGRYAEAARALDVVAHDFPDTPEAAFYLGVARLLSGDAADAREPLERARSAQTLGDAARWYGAVAAEQAGDAAAADVLLKALCAAPGDYRARACAALGVAP